MKCEIRMYLGFCGSLHAKISEQHGVVISKLQYPSHWQIPRSSFSKEYSPHCPKHELVPKEGQFSDMQRYLSLSVYEVTRHCKRKAYHQKKLDRSIYTDPHKLVKPPAFELCSPSKVKSSTCNMTHLRKELTWRLEGISGQLFCLFFFYFFIKRSNEHCVCF